MKKIDISIIIPAYNEAGRLPLFLGRVISYCDKSQRRYEIVVVDDGSKDNTFKIAASFKKSFDNLVLFKIRRNSGKGYAVKKGLLRSRGDICVFMDADGSTAPDEIEKNLRYISEGGYDIFVGSRVLKEKNQTLSVKWHRKLLGQLFNFCVQAFLFKNIKDTQCGFKMFKRETVKPLFSRSYLRRFGFDIEILYLAHKMGYRVLEGPVSWQHVNGSKVNLLIDPVRMFFNILQIRNWHCTPINTEHKYMGPDEYRYMFEMENYHWWFISHQNLAAYLVRSLKKSRPAILDIGSGTGSVLLTLNRLGKASGIDISERAISFCKKRGILDVAQCPAENIRYPSKSFDIVTCLDILEHTADTAEVLSEVKRLLRDNGKVILTVPAFAFLWSQHDEALCHLRRYDKKTLSLELREAGLRIERMGYFFFISFFIVAPIRMLRRLLAPLKKPHCDTTTLPPKVLNQLLKLWFNLEVKSLDFIKFPCGTTLYAVASKQ
ncbi:MAG: glycosyltransferase [Candidatus Omnitrophota bacterium]